MNLQSREQIAQAEWVANFLATHPIIQAPSIRIWGHSGGIDLGWHLSIGSRSDLESQREAAQEIIKSVGGSWEKEASGEDFYFRQETTVDYRGRQLEIFLTIYVARDAVCTRRVVGTEEVALPAVEAQPERVEVREIVEWDCEPILGDREDAA